MTEKSKCCTLCGTNVEDHLQPARDTRTFETMQKESCCPPCARWVNILAEGRQPNVWITGSFERYVEVPWDRTLEAKPHLAGHSGQRFLIQQPPEGPVKVWHETRNLWSSGTIPPHFRMHSDFAPNCRISVVTAASVWDRPCKDCGVRISPEVAGTLAGHRCPA